MRCKDKVVVVTGGAQGIGLATCEKFAQEGAKVVIADVDSVRGAEAAQQLLTAGHQALFLGADVADEASVMRLVQAVVAAWGRIDVLVNNAAVFILRGIDATVQEWRTILDVNVMGPVLVAKHVVPVMRRHGGGAIVNLGSISSFIAQPEFVTYNATKGAIVQITRCLALDLAKDNIRVNSVCPGTVWTRIVEKITSERGLDRAGADNHPDWGGAGFLKRVADPREIANAIFFLASDEASYVTGENLMVDGGYVAR